MDVRWLWIFGLVSCVLVNVRAASYEDEYSYDVHAPDGERVAAAVRMDFAPLSRMRRYLAETAGSDGGGGGGGGGGSGPQYTKPLTGAEAEAGRYKTTAASAPAAPAPTSGNVTEMASGTNETTTGGAAVAGAGAAVVGSSSNSSAAAAVPSASPTAATAVSGSTAAAAGGAAPSAAPAASQVPPSTVPSEVQPVQTSMAEAAAAAAAELAKEMVPEAEGGDDLGRYPQIFTNQTFKSHNISSTDEDHHLYYNSTMVTDEALARDLWVNTANNKDVHVNPMLSQSHRRASTVRLSFDFPFYGHPVRNVTVATGGFVYMGDFIHSWLAATQYVAPLMANFDTSISDNSYVKYIDNGTAFTVQWEDVHLQDRSEVGGFSFQLTLHRSGDIVFIYRNVPLPIEDIADYYHPVKVGISDAYIIDRNIFFVRRKTIYEYHRVTFSHEDIQNGTVITLTALPTCRSAKDCTTCITGITNFECLWCKGHCSDGMDRRRQEWLEQSCDKLGIGDVAHCPLPTAHSQQVLPSEQPVVQPQPQPQPQASGHSGAEEEVAASSAEAARSEQQRTIAGLHMSDGGSVSVSGVVAILSVVTLVCATAVWILYAYRNPHTASGQFLIRYRPSQWSWRRGEARYTAATIHM